MATRFGVYPEGHEVVEDPSNQRLLVRTPYYEVEHGLDRGGLIRGIRFLKVAQADLLLAPCEMAVGLAGAPKAFTPSARARFQVQRGEEEVCLRFEGPLADPDGHAAPVRLTTEYIHRWGHIKIRQQLHFPGAGQEVRWLLSHAWTLRPELTHFGVRPGAPAEVSSAPGAFGVCQWGRFQPGRAFDCVHESRYVPRYVGFADPGRCGLEWFVGSRLAQWDYQLAGRPGCGSLCIAAQGNPPGVVLRICPLDLSRGGVRLKGRYEFDFTIGIPILAGWAHPPYLHTSFNRKRWPTETRVAQWARHGIRTAHFHHDGDSFRDGLFWRDGKYPPFESRDMKQFDRVIAACHRHDIRVATYFSNKELHPSVAAFKAHGPEWARLPDDRRQMLHNQYSGDEFGAQMCLRSEWLEFHKRYIDTVLAHHALDGTYFDWNVALYCHNPRHVGMKPDRVAGIGAQANSAAGHWDMDELLELMQWTRRRVGPDGLMIVHNTMVPMAATENFADYVVAMEWGYSRLSRGAPELDDLPLEWNFMGSRSRGVIGYGCLDPSAAPAVQRQMNLRCLLTGVAPWTAQDLDLRMFAPLRPHDLARYTFHDWRSGLVTASDAGAAAAAYCRPDRALALVGNLRGTPRNIRCYPALGRPEFPRARTYRVVIAGRKALRVTASVLAKEGLTVRLPANGLAVVRIET